MRAASAPLQASPALTVASGSGTGSQADRRLKWASLLLLVAQTVSVVFAMRLSKSVKSAGQSYLNTSAVFSSEVLKMLCSFLFMCLDEGGVSLAAHAVWTQFVMNPKEAAKVAAPALLYTLQNNLIFVSISNLSGAVYQVTYQLKILTTAVLSVLLLGRHLGCAKWSALGILTVGVALIQLPRSSSLSSAAAIPAKGSAAVGLSAVLAACVTSGLAGVALEMVFKQPGGASLWLRNVQLGFFGSALALAAAYSHDGEAIREGGLLQGYSGLVWVVIWLQAVGGLIVAFVMRYADNLLKCFANALSIVITCALSALVKEFMPDMLFVLGTLLVLTATTLYSCGVPESVSGTKGGLWAGGISFKHVFCPSHIKKDL